MKLLERTDAVYCPESLHAILFRRNGQSEVNSLICPIVKTKTIRSVYKWEELFVLEDFF